MQTLKEIPQVGKEYVVPCINAIRNGKTLLTPIINDFEIDEDIDNNLLYHTHIDIRFCTDEMLKFHQNENSRLEYDILVIHCHINDKQQIKNQIQIQYEKFKCVRNHNMNIFGKLSHLEKLHSNKKMKCNRCPHKNTDLSSYPSDQNENVRCPAHGLQWNRNNGNLVPVKLIQEILIENYIKNHPIPKQCNISTYSNNINELVNEQITLNCFDINYTTLANVNINNNPLTFQCEMNLNFNHELSANGLIFWKENYPHPIYIGFFRNQISTNKIYVNINFNPSTT